MSPGTSSLDGTTSNFPFLMTFATWLLSFCNASNDFSALFSCITPIIAFTITTINIITVSVIPEIPSSITPTTPEIIAEIISTIIIKSLNCSRNFTIRLFFFFASNSFMPYFFLLASTSACVIPLS